MDALDLMMGAASGAAAEKLYVDDVFSTYLYTGNNSTQTIDNGIDLAGKGGLVWTKSRSDALSHVLVDNLRTVSKALSTNLTDAQDNQPGGVTSFTSSGYSLGSSVHFNYNTATYASWTFRKAPKFFDVVTYAGQNSRKTISHSLGIAPGMIILKCTSSSEAEGWVVYHRSTGTGSVLKLNTTGAISSSAYFVSVTSTDFQLEFQPGTNASGKTYVAYLFAHDPSADGIIQCGSYTTDGSGNATVTLGWEPQWILDKSSSANNAWVLIDALRGMPVGTGSRALEPHTASAESGGATFSPTPTGFTTTRGASTTYIYLAIRRPNKPPTSGTEVFSPQISGDSNTITTGFPIDTQIQAYRLGGQPTPVIFDRLRGVSTTSTIQHTVTLRTSGATAPEATNSMQSKAWSNTGYVAVLNSSVTWNFRRAPGFFDVVCYTGDNTDGRAVQHNLTVAPELIIVKARSQAYDWCVYLPKVSATNTLYLQTTQAFLGAARYFFGNGTVAIAPTVSNFYVGRAGGAGTNTGVTHVAYLFASLPGISKVGSYTGNGSSQTINCGFSAGARFILIKRTDATGDWYVWDTARGIVAANDPHLSLNTTAAEVTTDDSVDPHSSGFIVNQVAATNVNVNGATYIYLAIA